MYFLKIGCITNVFLIAMTCLSTLTEIPDSSAYFKLLIEAFKKNFMLICGWQLVVLVNVIQCYKWQFIQSTNQL